MEETGEDVSTCLVSPSFPVTAQRDGQKPQADTSGACIGLVQTAWWHVLTGMKLSKTVAVEMLTPMEFIGALGVACHNGGDSRELG